MDVYKIFYRAYYEWRKKTLLDIDGKKYGLTEENYFESVLQPTSLTEGDFNKYERKSGLTFPVSFKKYYSSCFSLEKNFQLPVIQLVAAWKEDPFKPLKDLLFENRYSATMRKNGLIPVGTWHGNFYICLDTNAGNQYDMPITLYDLHDGDKPDEAISPKHWFSSFEKFIACMTDYIKNGTDDNFNTIDPANNYMTAYE